MKWIVALIAAAVAANLFLPIATHADPVQGIPGYLDPKTRSFIPMPRAPTTADAASLFRTGAIQLTTTVQVKSPIPESQEITCQVSLSAYDAAFTNTASGSSVAVRSGTTATCTTTVYFLFRIADTNTTMDINLSVYSYSASSLRDLTRSVATIPVPNSTRAMSITVAI